MKKKLITSALPYIHGIPHLGNITSSVLPADIYSRFCRLRGERVLYICGSDSHGTMFEIKAKEKGTTPEKIVYENHERAKEIFKNFNLSFDYYGITHSKTNKKFTDYFFKKLDENGYIKEKEVEIAYCPNCKMFLADRFIEGVCPHCKGLARGDQCDDCGKLLDIKEVENPFCVLCGNNIEFRKTKHLFLDLPKFEPWLKEFVDKSNGWSLLAKSETKGFLRQGLKERSITRDSSWGFKVPKEGFEDKVFYVWVDAPIGYISFTEEWCKENNEKLEEWWKSNDTELIQFMGKDNIIFHSIIFPAMMKGTGENWKFVDRLIASGWLKAKDIKFSKSRNKGLTTEKALNDYPADYWRYILTALYPENMDSIFSMDFFKEKINNEFADIIGNFIHRVISFSYSNFKEIPKIDKEKPEELKKTDEIFKSVTEKFKDCRFREALKDIVHYAKISNAYFNNKEPWHKEEEEKKEICFFSGNLIKNLAILLYPIVPEFSEKVFELLNIDKNKVTWEDAGKFEFSGKIKKSKPLIQKIN